MAERWPFRAATSHYVDAPMALGFRVIPFNAAFSHSPRHVCPRVPCRGNVAWAQITHFTALKDGVVALFSRPRRCHFTPTVSCLPRTKTLKSFFDYSLCEHSPLLVERGFFWALNPCRCVFPGLAMFRFQIVPPFDSFHRSRAFLLTDPPAILVGLFPEFFKPTLFSSYLFLFFPLSFRFTLLPFTLPPPFIFLTLLLYIF